jgi:YD repeat-containing protein
MVRPALVVVVVVVALAGCVRPAVGGAALDDGAGDVAGCSCDCEAGVDGIDVVDNVLWRPRRVVLDGFFVVRFGYDDVAVAPDTFRLTSLAIGTDLRDDENAAPLTRYDFDYDDAGLVAVTRSDDVGDGTRSLATTTALERDDAGRVVRFDRAEVGYDFDTAVDYDDAGDIVEVTREIAVAGYRQRERFVKNELGTLCERRLTIDDASNGPFQETERLFWSDGHLAGVDVDSDFDDDDRGERFFYDDDGRVVRRVGDDGVAEGFFYDDAGRVVRVERGASDDIDDDTGDDDFVDVSTIEYEGGFVDGFDLAPFALRHFDLGGRFFRAPGAPQVLRELAANGQVDAG